jgi:hypothetical protein
MDCQGLRLGIACAALLGIASACGNGDTSDVDGGRRIELMDAGPGSDSGRPTGTDSGPGGDCPPRTDPLPAGNACARATLTCLQGAASAAAQQACIEADPNPMACIACINGEIFSTCTSGTATCADEYGLLQCCLEEACPDGADACINGALSGTGACVATFDTLNSCFSTEQMAMRCGVSALCFGPATAGDGGAPRPDGGT